jgi:hypothetical protein
MYPNITNRFFLTQQLTTAYNTHARLNGLCIDGSAQEQFFTEKRRELELAEVKADAQSAAEEWLAEGREQGLLLWNCAPQQWGLMMYFGHIIPQKVLRNAEIPPGQQQTLAEMFADVEMEFSKLSDGEKSWWGRYEKSSIYQVASTDIQHEYYVVWELFRRLYPQRPVRKLPDVVVLPSVQQQYSVQSTWQQSYLAEASYNDYMDQQQSGKSIENPIVI